MRLLLEGKVGIDFVTYVHPIMNQRKRLNLFPLVTVKPAAITGLTRPAVLREHIAAGKTLGEEASTTLLLHRCHPWAEATGFGAGQVFYRWDAAKGQASGFDTGEIWK